MARTKGEGGSRPDEPESAGTPDRAQPAKPPQNRDFGEAPPRSILVQLTEGTTAATTTAAAGADRLARLEEIAGVRPVPAFERVLGRVYGAVPASRGPVIQSRLASFYQIPIKDDDSARDTAAVIRDELKNEVVAAIPEPLAVPAVAPATAEPASIEQTLIPDLTSLQWHLGPAPAGLGVLPAWRYLGADGLGVSVVDLEGGWRLDHVALGAVRFNLWNGRSEDGAAWQDHGTAVVGLLGAPRSGPGVVGVCPLARVGMISAFPKGGNRQRVAAQIVAALEFLRAGDVLLIELQRPGPAVDYEPNADQKGYIPVSFWPDVSAAIATVVEAGVCVIEVAGNGGQNLDDAIYEGRFDQQKNDTGGIFVGAGAPPTGEFGPPRSRMPFSNFGTRLDCQAGGQLVVSAGYGDLWGGDDVTQAYTGRFSGTSSAGPLVVGVVACLQGRARAARGYPINSEEIRWVLANIGVPQAARPDGPATQRIGPQPDLMTLLSVFGLA